MIFRAVVAVVLLVSATAEEKKGDITFWMGKVKLQCPMTGNWHKVIGTKEEDLHQDEPYEYEYTGKKDLFYCKYTDNASKDKKYFFYIQGKECKNCIELDGFVYAVVTVADVIVTVLIMAMVYKCTKKKATQHEASHPNVQIPQGSDYEPLNMHTRASEYSTVVTRMG